MSPGPIRAAVDALNERKTAAGRGSLLEGTGPLVVRRGDGPPTWHAGLDLDPTELNEVALMMAANYLAVMTRESHQPEILRATLEGSFRDGLAIGILLEKGRLDGDAASA